VNDNQLFTRVVGMQFNSKFNGKLLLLRR